MNSMGSEKALSTRKAPAVSKTNERMLTTTIQFLIIRRVGVIDSGGCIAALQRNQATNGGLRPSGSKTQIGNVQINEITNIPRPRCAVNAAVSRQATPKMTPWLYRASGLASRSRAAARWTPHSGQRDRLVSPVRSYPHRPQHGASFRPEDAVSSRFTIDAQPTAARACRTAFLNIMSPTVSPDRTEGSSRVQVGCCDHRV